MTGTGLATTGTPGRDRASEERVAAGGAGSTGLTGMSQRAPLTRAVPVRRQNSVGDTGRVPMPVPVVPVAPRRPGRRPGMGLRRTRQSLVHGPGQSWPAPPRNPGLGTQTGTLTGTGNRTVGPSHHRKDGPMTLALNTIKNDWWRIQEHGASSGCFVCTG